MIKRIIFGLIIGAIGTFFYVQNDPWVRGTVARRLEQSLAKTFNCTVSLTVDSYDLLFPTISLSNFSMRAHDGSWSWHTQRYATEFSWLQFLKTGAIDMRASLKAIEARSQWHDEYPAIIPHLYALMKGPDLLVPAFLSSIIFQQGVLKLLRDDTEIEMRWNCDWKQNASLVKAHITLLDGTIQHCGDIYGSRLQGRLSLESTGEQSARSYRMRLDSTCRIPQLGEYPTCAISGSWHDGRGRFDLQSADRSFRIHPLILGKKQDGLFVDGAASVPLSLLYNLMFKTTDSPLKGSCAIQANGALNDTGNLDGHIICQDITYPSFPELAQLNGHFKKRGTNWQANWHAESGIAHAWSGSLAWDNAQHNAHGLIVNERLAALPYLKSWFIPAHEALFSWQYDLSTAQGIGSYDASLCSPTGELTPIEGHGSINADKDITLAGTLGNYKYELCVDGVQKCLSHFKLYDQLHKPRVSFNAPNSKSYTAAVDFSIIQRLCKLFMQYELQGEGTIQASGTKRGMLFDTAFSFEHATVRLPQTYNFISSMRGKIITDFNSKVITLKELFCSLHNGSLSCPEGVLWFDSAGKIPFVHMPVFINRCLVTAKQDLFAMVSGNLLLTKKGESDPHLSGHLMLNRSQLKENIFSEQAQKKLFHAVGTVREHKAFPLTCDLTVETKDPVRVDTNFLQANAHACLRLRGSFAEPIVEGTISVPSGSLAFPYKPLTITKGEITFSADQPLNPLVNLTAKNSIKNHAITLNVTGTLREHMVLLESNPPLSEEQIVGLLISGAHEDTLDAIIPALLMQNVTNFIFSSHKLNFFDQHIKPWMKQVNVMLKPKFGDQAGRGGLRGALEITVNDRWRALIEKNFSLTEDTNFELEYILSDDITFRILRDERRDIGGEVEMKLKF